MSLIHGDHVDRTSFKGSWTLTIQRVPVSANVSRDRHWGHRLAALKEWFYLVRAAEGFLEISRPTGKRWVLIVRHGKSPLDRDNLWASVKPIVDVLRPPRHDEGVHKTGAKKGEFWSRDRMGHGLILEDDDAHLDLKVINGPLGKGETPYTTIRISDSQEA